MGHRTERDLVLRRRKALHTLMHKDRVTSKADLLSSWPLHVQMMV
jgi:hypothetical protein